MLFLPSKMLKNDEGLTDSILFTYFNEFSI